MNSATSFTLSIRNVSGRGLGERDLISTAGIYTEVRFGPAPRNLIDLAPSIRTSVYFPRGETSPTLHAFLAASNEIGQHFFAVYLDAISPAALWKHVLGASYAIKFSKANPVLPLPPQWNASLTSSFPSIKNNRQSAGHMTHERENSRMSFAHDEICSFGGNRLFVGTAHR